MTYYTLDVSRLLSRSREAVPTGIDRVELAYAEYLMRQAPERTEFAALHPLGRFGSVNFEAASRFIHRLSARWAQAGQDDGRAVLASRRALHRQILLAPEPARRTGESRGAYLLLSHHHLTRPRVIARAIGRRRGNAFVPMVHDLIPSDYPEYARPRESEKHLRRIATVARLADGIIVPSESVKCQLLPHLRYAGRAGLPVAVIRHGVLLPSHTNALPAPGARPYFVCLGTIEPRKNHLLLLNIWRRLVETHGESAPRLVLIGRRGWENENVLDMIERCPALRNTVEEHDALPDAEVSRLMLGARALLFPSFAEGFGLPLAEALALGVNVVCSDIPVFREVGGSAPEYLDPLDGLGWLRAIERRSLAPAPTANVNWQAVSWPESIARAMHFIEQITNSRLQ
jgi:glycosyltransferase involved in cell wall biosynthesis